MLGGATARRTWSETQTEAACPRMVSLALSTLRCVKTGSSCKWVSHDIREFWRSQIVPLGNRRIVRPPRDHSPSCSYSIAPVMMQHEHPSEG